MIAYVFLAVGCGATAACVYAVGPAGRGAHRYVVPRKQLRAEAVRADAEAEDLACRLRALGAELDGVYDELDAARDERDNARAAVEKAALRIADLEETAREADRLRETNQALRARLANLTAIRPLLPATLPAPATPTPSAVALPLSQSPLARPAAEPS